MTDTGQVPGEGLPESAGMVEQPGVPAHGAYTYLSESPAEDEELLLPGAQGAWGNEVPPPTPEPVVETVHQPGPHETAGRDSGSVDLSGVRLPDTPVSVPPSPILSAPHDPATHTPRRPLHLGPPIPDASASPVRSLADRGPAGAPVRHPGPPTTGPEYLDAQPLRDLAPQSAVPWGATPAAPVAVQEAAPEPVAPAAEPVAAAPAARRRRRAAPAPDERLVHVHEGAQGAQAHDGVPAVPATEDGPTAMAAQTPEGLPDTPAVDTQAVPVAPATGGADAVPGTPLAPHGVQTPPEPSAPEVPYVPEPGQTPPEGVPTHDVPVQQDAPSAPEEPAPAAFPDAVAQAPEVQAGPEGPLQLDLDGAREAPAPAQAPATAEPVAPVEQPSDLQAAAPVPAPDTEAVPATPDAAEASAPAPEPAPAVQEAVPVVQDAVPFVPAPDAVEPQTGAEAVAMAPAPDAEPQPPAPEFVAPTEADPVAEAQGPRHAPESQQPVPPAAPAEEHLAPADVQPEQGPQLQPAAPVPGPQETPEPQLVEPAPAVLEPHPAADAPLALEPEAAAPLDQTLPSSVPLEPAPDQPLGQFVPVEGQVPTTPHLAPTPPQPLVLPVQEQGERTGEEPVAAVPGPREAEPVTDVVQHAEDLETRAADQEDEAAEAAESVAMAEMAEVVEAVEPRRPVGPAAPGYDDAEREAVLKVMRERRDIRNGFRGDPIPHEVLLRVLEAAHTAPSVGHSQPWDFVVIRSAETRRTMHELAMRQRDAYAKSLPKGRAKQFKELKIEAILDTPVNIVVTADPTRGGRHTLGRHTQPQMAPYSSALAVENLWLAARAEGLGVGWVSFFDEREMVRALGLPEHLEVVAYLCVGYVDEFPEEPELMQAGWSKRRPLSWVVHEETYGRRALPGEDPHDLLAETVAGIRPLDAKALGEAWERQKRMTKPPGALGMLEIISAQLAGLSRQCPPPIPEPAAVAIFAGDHGVHAQGVTPWPQEVTAQMVANFLGGGAVCNAFAAQVGAEVCVIDVGVATDLPATPGLLPRKVRAGTSDMTTGPAMTREEAKQAIEVGIETARDLVAAGNKALLTGEMGIANTTASAALISVFTGADPAEVTGRGTGINDETLARKTEVVRRALELHQPDPADPIGVLAAVGGFEHAAMVGLLLGGASLRTPVILDGVSAGAAALVARAIAPEVLAACIAGHRSAEPGHVAALNKLGLRPLVDLDLRLGEGTGALLALPLVQSTARAMHEVATFDSAGVTEK
ncbi:nicotinate-nucleotide--dimethylbenzimidazole phosphoribosyltransferase [Streptomyces sp. NPDC026672]|uniref:nicotinate-nucleotide--dimethylbenzimidazole phosphoribosyltransferase n=1 Tax=unclassified Streptomyces TaxID=2593676 RepID=UPI0034079820